MLAIIIHPNFDPVVLQLGPFAVHWYALAYVVGILFAVWYIKYLARQPRLWGASPATLNATEADEFFIYALLGVIVGGRLGYVLFYKPLFYLANPLDILKTWDGGMSFHGGFLGVVIACVVYGRPRGKTLDRMLDLGAASVPVGLGLGRIANFINAELWGGPSNLPWAVVFPGETFPRHPSQLYEALLEGLFLFIAVRIATHHFAALKYPGRASGIFATGYALSRILVEFVREPDAHLGYFAGVLTMGMILSLPLLAVGIWLLLRSRKTQ
ncbi:MAG: prolipoprotein diacylglyceryl transferase [Phyllobacteriaceae bacterium]|jgi:phosphatidylglycerol:prolipoprotein diacylglycerol transferase|nr:prolipoprotein diacylglyceryl transferase [Phyllobacteriaceae bacterium]